MSSTGGSSSSGGALGTGGATSSGGAPGAGGASSSGGVLSAGGASSSGGVAGTGGASGSGGASGKGGTSGTGGASGKGGTSGNGGVSGKGGTSGNGGATGAGGSGTASCTLQTTDVTTANYPGGLTLTKACSPYKVDQISVHDGGVLTIEAGATLQFSPNTAIYVGQTGTGKLVAKGTAQNPITLTAQDTSTSGEGWYGIEFYQGTASGSTVSYTTIDLAGGNYDAAIMGESGLPKNAATLDHVTINNSFSGAIMVTDATSSFIITNCIMDGAACP
jgi:hypothetical protein